MADTLGDREYTGCIHHSFERHTAELSQITIHATFWQWQRGDINNREMLHKLDITPILDK